MLFNRLTKFSRHLFRALLLFSVILFLGVTTTAFKTGTPAQTGVARQVRDLFLRDVQALKQKAQHLRRVVVLLEKNEVTLKEAQAAFYSVKQAYKKAEYLLEYLNPEIAKNLNGAPLPRVLIEQEKYQTLAFEKPKVRTFPALGLQVLEELLFAEEFSRENVSYPRC